MNFQFFAVSYSSTSFQLGKDLLEALVLGRIDRLHAAVGQ